MNRTIAGFLLFIGILLLTACNSREDVQHISQKDMVQYVKAAVGEEVSLVRVNGNDEDSVMTYEFKLNGRDATFTATSVISALSLDGAQIGNYSESIYIKYEEGIAESESYIAERARAAKELGIRDEDMKFGLSIIALDNYKDIDKAARFVVRLDELYAFNEKKPERIEHIDAGAISFHDPGNSIDGPRFSTNKNSRLKYKDVYSEIAASYIKQLKKFGDRDPEIPEKIWGKYK